MTEADRIAAAEAEQLRGNKTFQAAILQIRKIALDELAKADPTNADAIREHQATVRAIDRLMGEVARVILKGTPQRSPAVA